MHLRMALDRSMRSTDRAGNLRVEVTNISKAAVNPYRGSEIPDPDGSLRLDPNRVYWLLRDAAELAAAAATFNNLPLLRTHVPITADAPRPDLVVGATGSNATYAAPYLQNSIIVWDSEPIALIESGDQCELSSAYWYRADMTPGEFEGKRYDGVMRDIHGNHVALVESGRAGPDVVVADSNPFHKVLSMKKLSRTALAVRAAIGAALLPRLAQDAKMPDLLPSLQGVSQKTLKPQALAATLLAALPAGAIAQDSAITAADLQKVITMAADGVEDDKDDEKKVAKDSDEDEETEEEKAKRLAKDSEKDDEDDKKKPAMDAAMVATAVKNAEARAVARFQAIRTAERAVQPFVGEVVAQDSAAAVYKLALDAAGIDLTGVPEGAYAAMVGMLPKPGTATTTAPTRVAMDSAGASDFAKRFPTAVAPARG